MREPTTAADSSASRACGDSRCTRARTASCTVGGQLRAAGGDDLGDEERVAAGLS